MSLRGNRAFADTLLCLVGTLKPEHIKHTEAIHLQVDRHVVEQRHAVLQAARHRINVLIDHKRAAHAALDPAGVLTRIAYSQQIGALEEALQAIEELK